MAKSWNGQDYDEDWNTLGPMGVRTGGRADQGTQDAWNAAHPSSPNTNQFSAPAPTGPTTDWQGLSNNVMGAINRDINRTGVVDQADPAYRQAVDANELQTNLAAQRARAAAVQRRAATGTGTSGAVDTDVNKILEDQALQNKTFEGNLLGQFRQQELARAQQGLQLGSGMLTAEQERQLRAALTREGYDVQRDLAADDLNFRRDALGQQLGLSQAQMDQQAMLALLGGG